jgi:hypothetical protein
MMGLRLKPTLVTNWDTSTVVIQRLVCECGADLPVTTKDMQAMTVVCGVCDAKHELVLQDASTPNSGE